MPQWRCPVSGDVVQIGAADVDRAKTDVANITGVVVEHEEQEGVLHYRVAAQAGVLKAVYARHQLKPLRQSAALLGLDAVLKVWKSLPQVGERSCMLLVSAVGGQGVVHCHCAGRCDTKRCACRYNNRMCNSRCHVRNKVCKNNE